ncbi:MAG TPA: DUF1292 domain-containing protein [Desulfosporosinus sp.]|jgi:uncharacterized protein YrzB (UPF0473 family)|nr:DUF1292 domain-containing protein [Desulfosporosinus sp.]
MTEKPHDHENCKCNDHNHEDHDAEEFDTVVLTDDEGVDHEFLHLDTLELEGSTYFVLMPISEDESADEDDDEAIILKLGKDAEGGEMLLDIEDDEEWEKVADAWENLVESEEDDAE